MAGITHAVLFPDLERLVKRDIFEIFECLYELRATHRGLAVMHGQERRPLSSDCRLMLDCKRLEADARFGSVVSCGSSSNRPTGPYGSVRYYCIENFPGFFRIILLVESDYDVLMFANSTLSMTLKTWQFGDLAESYFYLRLFNTSQAVV